jgi:hypothetical protein
MPLPRLAFMLLALPLLAACEGSPPPAATDAGTAPAAEAEAEASPPASDTAATAPIFGTFAADLGWCDGDTGGDGFPVTITPEEFRGRENICAITGIDEAEDGSYEAQLACTAEGQTVEERLLLVPIFAPSGEGLRITYLDREGATATLLRCT